MKISGFTMVKNADKLYYPFKESVLSILPIVDEFVIALGDCDESDQTLQMIEEINSPKIKIVNTVWDTKKYQHGSILAQQTDVAKEHCTGDWLFYLQADEVIHEKDHQTIRQRCEELIDNHDVEGLIFKYIHFWGDYNHAFTANHAWYRNEIRIIRNRPDIHSWRDAQSFKAIANFTEDMYLKKEGTRKLNVARVDAHVYHYGWVRPPRLLGKKQLSFDNLYDKNNRTEEEQLEVISEIDFGAMGHIPKFKGEHPSYMNAKIKDFHWAQDLNYSQTLNREPKYRHERPKYKLVSFIEKLFAPNGIFVFKNYKLLK